MNTKIGKSFGLAFMLAIGVLATMLALGLFTPSGARADLDVQNITLSKNSSGAVTQITITFMHNNTLTAGSGQLAVTFDKTWGIPSTLQKEHVTLTTSQTTGGTSNPAIDPSVVAGANSTVITITIGDTNVSLAGVQGMEPPNAASLGTTAGSPHILVFSPLAGISVPTSQATTGSSWIHVSTTSDATATDGAVPTTGSYTTASYDPTVTASIVGPRATSLDATSGTNGTTVTATGKGYVTGTLTAFIDAGTSGQFDSGTDTVIGTSVAAVSGGTATVIFTVSVPTFSAGANSINLMDGNGNVDGTPATFTLIGIVTTSKTQVKRGESVVVKLRQYTAGDVTSITFGGSGATLPTTVTVPASGTLNLTVTVPTTTPLGTQRVNVIGGATRFASIEVIGAPMELSPSTAVPNQTITVSGSGFNATSDIASMTIGNFAIPAANIASNTTVTTDNSGNMVAQVKIPIDATDATTRTAGSYTLTVTDGSGRTGQATLTIPSRSLTLSPASSRRASTVTIDGTGFPASSSITLTYGSTTVGSVTPDSAGVFSATITVPSSGTDAGIPSANTITATSTAAGTPAGTGAHTIPGATISIAESSAVSGSKITVSGEGFPGFSTMSNLTIGGTSAIGTPAPNTDIDGKFTETFLVPQLSAGTQTVLATIGGINANSSVTITTAPVAPVVSTNATEVVFAADIASDNLVRVWHFSNATQAWSFFDPRPAFATSNSLSEATTGDIVWVNLVAATTFQGQSLLAGWSLVVLD